MAMFEGSRRPALVLTVERQVYVFQLVHCNQIIAQMWALSAYNQINWNGSFADFIETWLYLQEAPYYGPLNRCSYYVQRKPIRRSEKDESNLSVSD